MLDAFCAGIMLCNKKCQEKTKCVLSPEQQKS